MSDPRRLLRAGAYSVAALFLVLALRAWLRPAQPGAVPDVLADASRPDPLPMDAEASSAKDRPVVRAPGEPLEPEARLADEAARAAAAAAPMTNEQLHAALEREKARMGIKRIVAPRLSPDGGLPVPAPALSGTTPALLAKAPAAPAAAAPAQIAQAAGVIILSEAERAALWASKDMAAAAPTVDYSRQRLAVVFSQGPRYGIEVAAVQTFSDRVVVQYREPEIPADAQRQSRAPAYQFRVLPLSDKPVIFQKLP